MVHADHAFHRLVEQFIDRVRRSVISPSCPVGHAKVRNAICGGGQVLQLFSVVDHADHAFHTRAEQLNDRLRC